MDQTVIWNMGETWRRELVE